MKRRYTDDGQPPLALIEEGVHLLRLAPAGTLACYYIGALPFAAGLLYFWADMSRGAYADQRCAPAAAGLTLLFLWMTVWQTVFVQRLRTQLTGTEPVRWHWRGLLRVAVIHAAWLPTAFITVPAGPVAYAFYQNLFYVADGETAELVPVARRAGKLAFLWIWPGHLTSLAIWAFGLFVFLNLALLVWLLPVMAKTLFGIESAFTRSHGWMVSSTLWAVVSVLTYLCVNPLTKAVYALRCFYGESRHTAADLRADLRAVGRKVALVAIIAASLWAGNLSAAPTPPSPPATANAEELNQAIERTLQKPRYLWRLPRERAPAAGEAGWLAKLRKEIGDWLTKTLQPLRDWWKKFNDWLRRLLRNRQPRERDLGGGGFWAESVHGLVVLLIGGIIAVVAILLLRWRKRRGQQKEATLTLEPAAAVPDVADENVRADQLPEDGWVARARELLAAGEWRLALRAFHLATLSHLAARELITLARYKSDCDYERELARRARTAAEIQSAFKQNRRLFESVWYGAHTAHADLITEYNTNFDAIRKGQS